MSLFQKAKQVEQDLLEEAHGISREALGWLFDLKDQLEHANGLYKSVQDEADEKIAGLKDAIASLEARKSAAQASVIKNETTLANVSALVPPSPEPVA